MKYLVELSLYLAIKQQKNKRQKKTKEKKQEMIFFLNIMVHLEFNHKYIEQNCFRGSLQQGLGMTVMKV